MQNQNFTTSFLVNQSPKEVFEAINNVRGWWSEQIEGNTDKLNEEFDYHYQDVHRCKIKIIEFISNEKVVWLVKENYFNFTKDSAEWTNDKMIFEISKKDNQTQLNFTQMGLNPMNECYDICSDSWGNYIGRSLKNLIETGKGNPNPFQKSIDNAEALKKENN